MDDLLETVEDFIMDDMADEIEDAEDEIEDGTPVFDAVDAIIGDAEDLEEEEDDEIEYEVEDDFIEYEL